MFQDTLPLASPPAGAGIRQPETLPELLAGLATQSKRPRYAFMVLHLIAGIARPDGRAGPYVEGAEGKVTLRDWLSDALSPISGRDPRRRTVAERVRADLARAGQLSSDPAAAAEAIADEVRVRSRQSGKTAVSRAVSDLVAAGLLRRHYQGWWVDHPNRGGQRHAVYTLTPPVRRLLGRLPPVAPPAPLEQSNFA